MEKKKMEESGVHRKKSLKNSAAWGTAAAISGLPSGSVEAKSKKSGRASFKPGMINTVLGPVSPDQLGTTLMHEHFCNAYPGWYADESIAPYNYQAVLKTNLGVIKTAQDCGIKTIVDATPADMSRKPGLYKALAQKTGINISPNLMVPYEEHTHKAAAVAQMATGVPIVTNTSEATGGVEEADLLLKQGADPKKVLISHVSNSKDKDFIPALKTQGISDEQIKIMMVENPRRYLPAGLVPRFINLITYLFTRD